MILASKSPRRREILESMGFRLKIIVPDVEERSGEKEIPARIMDIARQKTLALATEQPLLYVTGADTVVILDGEIIGKPADAADAASTLRRLSGREHRVLTAFSFRNLSRNTDICDYEITKVFFRDLDEELIRWYVGTGEPMDKAGSYGIQGKGALLAEKIDGDFFNVMGFPIARFARRILEEGLTPEQFPFL